MSHDERRLITTRQEFDDALRAAFAEVAAAGCRELWLCDDDFAAWPLNERAVVEHLAQWAMAHRHLTLIARSFDEFPRRHARWLEWRRVWSHVVSCRAVDEAQAADLPTLLVAPGVVTVRLADPVQCRGSVSWHAADLTKNRETAEAFFQRSGEALPVTLLGI